MTEATEMSENNLTNCDTIKLTSFTAEGLERALGQDFHRHELPDRMAWVVWQLKEIEDKPEFFPCGKWATIQEIERQLEKAAEYWKGVK